MFDFVARSCDYCRILDNKHGPELRNKATGCLPLGQGASQVEQLKKVDILEIEGAEAERVKNLIEQRRAQQTETQELGALGANAPKILQ